ncbi:hypothetical protein L1049_004036 [Liquidambar formosana]|uniref:Homeobox domain-containing protein n=1 Tax=Liquidambar formosana TaxID=63359 RepID=A0AAP0RMQ4_LIQFO
MNHGQFDPSSSENDSGDLVLSSSVQPTHGEEEQHNQPQARSMRKNIPYTQDQKKALEQEFLNCSYPTDEVRRKIAAQLQLTEKKVRSWFTNRQTKEKKNYLQVENNKLRCENAMLHEDLLKCLAIMGQCYYCRTHLCNRENGQQASVNGQPSSFNDALVNLVPAAYLSGQSMESINENDLNFNQCL